MHIAFTQRHLDSKNGGEERSLFTILKKLETRQGIKLSLFYSKKGDYNTQLPTSINQFELLSEELSLKNAIPFVLNCIKAAKFIKQNKIDILHVNHYKDITWAGLVKVLSGCQLGLHLRLNAPDYLSRQYAWGLKQVDFFIANSEFVKTDWRTYCNKEIKVIYNGIEPSSEQTKPINHPVDLVFIGRLVPEKGLHIALEALSQLEKTRTLSVIGDYKQQNESRYEEEIQKQLISLNLKDRVFFEGHQDNVSGYLRDATALLVPSLHDAFGRTYMEGWSLGTPTIASFSGGIIELVEKYPELKDYVFEENNATDLAIKIKNLPKSKPKLGLSFDLSTTIDDILVTFRNQIEQKRRD